MRVGFYYLITTFTLRVGSKILRCFMLPLGALRPGFAAEDYRLTVELALEAFAAVVRESRA